MSLGTYPEVTLREARSLRDEARTLLAKGTNPRVHRKQKRTAVRLADENTFEAVYRKWLKHRGLSLKEGRQATLSILPRIFDKDVLPASGKRSVYEIKRPDLLEVIAKIKKRKALSVAEKVRTSLNREEAQRADGQRQFARSAREDVRQRLVEVGVLAPRLAHRPLPHDTTRHHRCDVSHG
jgi:integrase